MEEIRLIESQEQPTVGIRHVVRMDDLPALYGRVLPQVAALLERAGVPPAGPPYSRYRGRMGDGVDVEAGFPVSDAAAVADLELDPDADKPTVDVLPTARVVETVHVGPYDRLAETYDRVEAWMADHHLQPLGEWWEFYESGPDSDPDPALWRTRVLVAVTAPAVTS